MRPCLLTLSFVALVAGGGACAGGRVNTRGRKREIPPGTSSLHAKAQPGAGQAEPGASGRSDRAASRADPEAIRDARRPAPERPWSSAAAYRHFLEGVVALEGGAFGRAEKELSEAVLHDPRSARLRLFLARAQWLAGRHRAARSSARTAMELDPDLLPARQLLAKIQRESGEFGAAEATLRAAMAVAPEAPGGYLDLAALLLQTGRSDEALGIYGALDSVHGKAGAPWRGLATALERAGHLPQARIALARAREAVPEDAAAAEAEGRICEALRERACAVLAYGDALALSGDRFYLLLRVARLLGELGRDDEALEAERRLVAGDPTSPDLLLQVALTAADRGQHDLALRRLRRARRIAPRRRDLWFFEGYVEETRGAWEAALTAYRQASSDPSHGLDARLARAALMARMGRDRAALAQLDRVTQTWAEGALLPELLALKIEVLARLGETKAFEAIFEQLPTGLVHDLRILAARSGAEVERGHPDAALRLLRAELRAWPREQSLRVLLATLLHRLQRKDEALEVMEAVVAVGPDRADALNFVAYAFAAAGVRLGEAEALARRALLLEPNNGYIQDTLGVVLLGQDRRAEAVEILRRAAKLLPGEAEILKHLGDALLPLDSEEAGEAYHRALRAPGLEQALRGELEEKVRALAASKQAP